MPVLRLVQPFLILIAGWFQTSPAITAPQAGQTLLGSVAITASYDPAAFSSGELSFGYAGDSTDTWFPIRLLNPLPSDGNLATWDTAAVTDGDYRLRLRLFSADGSYQDLLVPDLHVRNQAPPPSPTPAATATADVAFEPEPSLPEAEANFTPEPTALPAPALEDRPTPQPLPPNPAAITREAIYSIFTRGALAVLLLFAAIGILLRLRRG